jgi:hypothetical protein
VLDLTGRGLVTTYVDANVAQAWHIFSGRRKCRGVGHVTIDHKIIAMVAIKDTTRIDPVAVAARVKAMFPWLASQVGAPPVEPGQLDTCVIPIGDGIVPVIQMHFPIPDETLAYAIGKNWFWPEAKDEFAKCRAHVLVSALSPVNDPRLMRANAVRVTAVTAALAEMLPATGIYWSTAENVLAPAHFIAEAKEAGEDHTPFDLWVAVHFFPGPKFAQNQEIIARTAGMEVFIGREIECGPYVKEPGELGPIVRGVGHYVLDRRVQFGGGETIGTEENPIGQIALDRTRVGADSQAVYRVLLGEVGNG